MHRDLRRHQQALRAHVHGPQVDDPLHLAARLQCANDRTLYLGTR